MIKFGVAGNSASFYNEGYKKTLEAASWCKNRNIDAFEYSFGKGVIMSSETAESLGKEFAGQNVEMSVHTPYFINFANEQSEMIEKSINYVRQSVHKLLAFQGERLVIHPASQGKAERRTAVEKCKDNLKLLSEVIEAENLTEVKYCLETMGKIGQIGTLDEIIEFVNLSEYFYPCIDFGHINAREQGLLNSAKAFETLIKRMLDNLPFHKVENMHAHFSKIQYTARGEVRHLTFADEVYGPKFEDLAAVLKEYKLQPYLVCESDGTQAEDCVYMKNYYNSLFN